MTRKKKKKKHVQMQQKHHTSTPPKREWALMLSPGAQKGNAMVAQISIFLDSSFSMDGRMGGHAKKKSPVTGRHAASTQQPPAVVRMAPLVTSVNMGSSFARREQQEPRCKMPCCTSGLKNVRQQAEATRRGTIFSLEVNT